MGIRALGTTAANGRRSSQRRMNFAFEDEDHGSSTGASSTVSVYVITCDGVEYRHGGSSD